MACLGGHLGSCRWYPGLSASCPQPGAPGGMGTGKGRWGVSGKEGPRAWGCTGAVLQGHRLQDRAGHHRQGLQRLCPLRAAWGPRGRRARSGCCKETRGSPGTGPTRRGKGPHGYKPQPQPSQDGVHPARAACSRGDAAAAPSKPLPQTLILHPGDAEGSQPHPTHPGDAHASPARAEQPGHAD